MTIRAIAGVVLYNVALLGVGSALLWGLGAFRWVTEGVRLAGVSYLVGLAATMVVLSLELVLGIPVNGATGLLTLIALATAGVVVGLVRGRSRPTLRPPEWRFPRISILVALALAGIVVYFQGLFRQARLASALAEFDGWWNWIPKAKAIYFFDRLDAELLSFLPNQPYPPGMPAIHALAFHAMGGPDDVTLHLQYWFYAAAFVAAFVGLLADRVRAAILVPIVFLVVLAPSFVTWATRTYVDLPLGYQVATAALLVLLWLDERHPWQLVGATVLLGGAMLTKREGILFALCVIFAGFAASIAQRRECWPRLALAGIVAFALSLPWRIWFTANDIPSDGPSGGVVGGLADAERGWATTKLVVRTFFAYDVWLLAPFVGCAAIALGLLARAWRSSIYAGAFVLSAAAAAIWTIWAETALPIIMADDRNPIIRMTGTSILTLLALTPLLLERAWTAARGLRASGEPGRLIRLVDSRSLTAWAIVAVAALVMPVSMLVGYSGQTLPGGAPRFPGATDCVEAVIDGQPVRLVVGYATSVPDARELRTRAAAAGIRGSRAAQDGCGRLRVSVDGFATAASAETLVDRARAAGLEPSLERDSSSDAPA